jgi:hypothetical protein
MLTTEKETLVLHVEEQHQRLLSAVDIWWGGGQAILSTPPRPTTLPSGAYQKPYREESIGTAGPMSSPLRSTEGKMETNLAVRAVTKDVYTQTYIDELAKLQNGVAVFADGKGDSIIGDLNGTQNTEQEEEEVYLSQEAAKEADELAEFQKLEKMGPSIHETSHFKKTKTVHLINLLVGKDALFDPAQFKNLHAFVNGHFFEMCNAVLILANSVLVTMRVQYNGIQVGFEIDADKSRSSAEDTWPGAEGVFDSLEAIFGFTFMIELLLKFAVLKRKFIRAFWNVLDATLVGIWAVAWTLDTTDHNVARINPMMLRMLQLFRVMHVVRLFEAFKEMRIDSLLVLVGSIRASLSTFVWSCILLSSIQMLAALLTCQLCHIAILDDSTPEVSKQQLFNYFGTFSKALMTMFELSLANWVIVARVVANDVGEIAAFVILAYVLFLVFAVTKVISAAFIIETHRVVADTLELVVLEKERHNKRLVDNFWTVFREADTSGDGHVDWNEFQDIISDRRLTMQLQALDFDANVCEGMFGLLDDGDGKISFQEFIAGVKRLKGPAKSVDVVIMAQQQTKMFDSLAKIELKLEHQISSIMHDLKKMQKMVS